VRVDSPDERAVEHAKGVGTVAEQTECDVEPGGERCGRLGACGEVPMDEADPDASGAAGDVAAAELADLSPGSRGVPRCAVETSGRRCAEMLEGGPVRAPDL
jgi:hypothetical protein